MHAEELREKTTITVDSYTNFLFFNRDGLPKVDINYNSVVMGHVNITMMVDYYDHDDDGSAKAEMDRLAM